MHDAEPENNVPPPQLYPPREAHFEKFIEPRPDGYQKAKSRGGDRAAIVIDNGNAAPFAPISRTRLLIPNAQVRLELEPAGPLKMHLGSISHLYSLNTETESWARRIPSLGMMCLLTQLLADI